jgi:hypothetical protein
MNPAQRPSSSERAYALFVRAYPKSYQRQYRGLMEQLFADQCREAHKQGGFSIFALWLRTLLDLLISIPHEHIDALRQRWNNPLNYTNNPLPWSDVILALFPGLFLTLIQAGQLTLSSPLLDKPASLYFLYIGAFLTLAALAAFILSGHFPAWGLLPMGLLAGSLNQVMRFQINSGLRQLTMYFNEAGNIQAVLLINENWLYIVPGIYLILCLVILFAGRVRLQWRKASYWVLGAYILLLLTQSFLPLLIKYMPEGIYDQYMPQYIIQLLLSNLDSIGSAFLAILIGGLFAKRYGGLAILVVGGYFASSEVFSMLLPYAITNVAANLEEQVMVYSVLWRLLFIVIAPLLAMRGRSIGWRSSMILITAGLVLAFRLWLTLQIYYLPYQPDVLPIIVILNSITMYYWQFMIILEAIYIVAIPLTLLGLAFTLYQPGSNPTLQQSQVEKAVAAV